MSARIPDAPGGLRSAGRIVIEPPLALSRLGTVDELISIRHARRIPDENRRRLAARRFTEDDRLIAAPAGRSTRIVNPMNTVRFVSRLRTRTTSPLSFTVSNAYAPAPSDTPCRDTGALNVKYSSRLFSTDPADKVVAATNAPRIAPHEVCEK